MGLFENGVFWKQSVFIVNAKNGDVWKRLVFLSVFRMLNTIALKLTIDAFLTATIKGFVLKGVNNTDLLEQGRPVGSGRTGALLIILKAP